MHNTHTHAHVPVHRQYTAHVVACLPLHKSQYYNHKVCRPDHKETSNFLKPTIRVTTAAGRQTGYVHGGKCHTQMISEPSTVLMWVGDWKHYTPSPRDSYHCLATRASELQNVHIYMYVAYVCMWSQSLRLGSAKQLHLKKALFFQRKTWAASGGNQTLDILHTMQVLYQLSHQDSSAGRPNLSTFI